MPATIKPGGAEVQHLPIARLFLDDIESLIEILRDDGAEVTLSNDTYDFASPQDFEGWRAQKLYPLTIKRPAAPSVEVYIPASGAAQLKLGDGTNEVRTKALLVKDLWRRCRAPIRGVLIPALALLGGVMLVVTTILQAAIDDARSEESISRLQGIGFLTFLALGIWSIVAENQRTIIATKRRGESWWRQNWQTALWDAGLALAGLVVGYFLGQRSN